MKEFVYFCEDQGTSPLALLFMVSLRSFIVIKESLYSQ